MRDRLTVPALPRSPFGGSAALHRQIDIRNAVKTHPFDARDSCATAPFDVFRWASRPNKPGLQTPAFTLALWDNLRATLRQVRPVRGCPSRPR